MAHYQDLKTRPLFICTWGKRRASFPVPTKVYYETITTLQTAVHKAKLGNIEKSDAIKKLHTIAANTEKDFIAEQQTLMC